MEKIDRLLRQARKVKPPAPIVSVVELWAGLWTAKTYLSDGVCITNHDSKQAALYAVEVRCGDREPLVFIMDYGDGAA